eukprot:264787-Prymnesium_polylepis.2
MACGPLECGGQTHERATQDAARKVLVPSRAKGRDAIDTPAVCATPFSRSREWPAPSAVGSLCMGKAHTLHCTASIIHAFMCGTSWWKECTSTYFMQKPFC